MPPKKKPSRKSVVKVNKDIADKGMKRAKKVTARQKAAEDKAIVGRYGKNGSLAKQTHL